MPRTVEFEVVADTSHFTPLQLQPRALLALSFNAMSRWIKEYLVSFPALIREHRSSVVITGASIRYGEPLGFFDGDALRVKAGMRSVRRGSRLQLDAEFRGSGGARAADTRVLFCPVEVVDPLSLAAQPRKFSAELMGKFLPDESDPRPPEEPVPGLKEEIERLPKLAGRTSSFKVHRHHCEVADQWAFLEVPCLIGENGETLALERAAQVPELKAVLSRPLRHFDMELSRPYFWFQEGRAETSVYRAPEGPALVHRLLSAGPGQDVHGVVVERYA